MYLKSYIQIFDNLRKPIISNKRTHGIYPYYGAQGIIDYVDDYIFDGKYLLLAEDGNNLRTRTDDVARIVNGKFWLNNHAHIIKTNQNLLLEYLLYFLNTSDLSGYITGSAQPKLNKDNVESIKINVPSLDIQQHIVNSIDSEVKYAC